jgi:hypothetical protein
MLFILKMCVLFCLFTKKEKKTLKKFKLELLTFKHWTGVFIYNLINNQDNLKRFRICAF